MLKSIGLAILAGATMAPLALDKEWKATLSAREGSGIEGSAQVQAKGNDSTRMEVKIKHATATTTYAWHMHSGSCAVGGPIAGPASLYPPLQTDSAGKAEADVMLRIAAPGSGEYSIHVHAPPAESPAVEKADTTGTMAKPEPVSEGKTVACGDLKAQ